MFALGDLFGPPRTRYLPQADVTRQLLDADAIGDVQMVAADFGFAAPFDPTHRLFDPAQAGGALLDAGVYPISFAVSVLGPAVSTAAKGLSRRPAWTALRPCSPTTAGQSEPPWHR